MSVYVIIKLYHQPDLEYQEFFAMYTENFDAYLTNTEGATQGICIDTSMRRNIDTLIIDEEKKIDF